MVDGAKFLWSKCPAVRGRTLSTNASVAILWRGLLVLGVAILVVLILWKFPQWQVPEDPKLTVKDFLELRNKARGTLAQIIGGFGILLGLYLTYRRITAAEQTVQVAQEGQITERFTRAIDQLGSDKLEIRLGGIYALERIARDSEKDHWTIMEVLTAYVREHAPWKDSQQHQENELPVSGDHPPEKRVQHKEEGSPPKPLTDIQAILTVLGRSARVYGRGEEQRLDLQYAELRGADLTEAHLERANLFGAHLERARLWGSHLERARLIGVHLERAALREAHLEGADLRVANLSGADFWRARLKGADITGAIGLTKAQIESAIIDEHTKLPDYLKAPAEPETEE